MSYINLYIWPKYEKITTIFVEKMLEDLNINLDQMGPVMKDIVAVHTKNLFNIVFSSKSEWCYSDSMVDGFCILMKKKNHIKNEIIEYDGMKIQNAEFIFGNKDYNLEAKKNIFSRGGLILKKYLSKCAKEKKGDDSFLILDLEDITFVIFNTKDIDRVFNDFSLEYDPKYKIQDNFFILN